MTASYPFDLLAQCGACRIENLIADFRPGVFSVCNQCREPLARAGSVATHKEYACGDCGLRMLLLSDTPVTTGESECRCGKRNILILEDGPLLKDIESEAGPTDDDDTGGEDFYWCRSGPEVPISEDYNDLFDNDPGMS